MKGLVYKENMMFLKSIDKKMLLFVAAMVIAFIFTSDEYGSGPLASAMFAMIIGMRNVIGFVNDEKSDWKKYQMAMPVSAFSVIKAKYISVLCTTVVSLLGSIVFNFLSCAVFRSFHIFVLLASMVIAVIVPLLWTSIGIPLAYWFGFNTSQMVGLVAVMPIIYLVKHYDDGVGFLAMTNSIVSCTVIMGIGTVILFAVSMLISVAGYRKKK